jgi:hypothetical protein
MLAHLSGRPSRYMICGIMIGPTTLRPLPRVSLPLAWDIARAPGTVEGGGAWVREGESGWGRCSREWDDAAFTGGRAQPTERLTLAGLLAVLARRQLEFVAGEVGDGLQGLAQGAVDAGGARADLGAALRRLDDWI